MACAGRSRRAGRQSGREQRGIAPVKNYAAAFKSPRVIALSAQYFLWSIGVYGFVIWLPSILKTRDMGMVEVGLLSAVPYLAAVIARDRDLRHLFRSVAQAPAADLALPGLWRRRPFMARIFLGAAHFWASFVLLTIAGAMMYAPYGPFFAYIAETLPRNVVGGAIALINSMGALGSFVGAYGVGMLNGMTGSPGASYLMMAAALFVAAAITVMFAESEEPLLLDFRRNRSQRAVHEDGDGAITGLRLGAVIMHAIDQIGQHRALGIGHGIVVGVIDIAGRDPPGAVDHHRIAGMLMIMRMAEMAGMPFDQFQAGAGRVRIPDRPGGVAGLALLPLDLIGHQGDGMGGIDGGLAQRPARPMPRNMDARSMLLEHECLPVGLAWTIAGREPPFHLATA